MHSSQLAQAGNTAVPTATAPTDWACLTAHLEPVQAWGRASQGMSHVYRPNTPEGVHQLFELAVERGLSIGMRGGGNSYGDAAMNDENILLDLSRMNRILDWDPAEGRIRLEPGVTLAQLWQYIVGDGWWPPVVTGTMHTTIAGCAAMNVHGKNGWQVGPIGDHIDEFELMLPSGEVLTCNRQANSDLFYAAIGGFGTLGCFVSISLKLKRVYSGLLQVQAENRPNLAATFDYFDENLEDSDYIVGWMDAFAKGASLGRSNLHRANYLPPGVDPRPEQTLRLDFQHLPDNLFGVFPKSMIWRFMRPFINNPGTRLVNSARFYAAKIAGPHSAQQSHAAFHFLLDYVPGWKLAYGRGGLIQYQPFVPAENAQELFGEILRLCQRRGLPNYLTVIKRHRPDDFLISYGLDGYSLAMDFRITDRNRMRIASLAQEMDEMVLGAGGRFYFAKDSTLRPSAAIAYLGEDVIQKFRQLKARCDPDEVLQTNLWRRVFC